MASVNIIDKALSTANSFYIESSFITQGKVNGNALVDNYISGQIKYSDFKRCYNSYVIDLERAISETDDDQPATLIIDFKVDMRREVKYDFLILTEYEAGCYIDRFNAIVMSKTESDLWQGR